VRKADAVILAGPFRQELGYAFTGSLPPLPIGDSNDAERRSKIVLCEDDTPLGPPHALHDDIRQMGRGRFSHWRHSLYFSASDHTDPNTNNRTYCIIDLSDAR